jgi:hypothetical protein
MPVGVRAGPMRLAIAGCAVRALPGKSHGLASLCNGNEVDVVQG